MSCNQTAEKEGSANAKARALVRRYARGNVCIQVDRFVTAEEKKERRQRVLAMKFV